MFEKLHPQYHVVKSMCHDLMVYMIFDNINPSKSEFLLFLNETFPIGFKNTRIICFDFYDHETIELLTDISEKEHWLFSRKTKEYIQILPEDANIFTHGLSQIFEKEHDQATDDKNLELVYSTKSTK